MKNNLSNSPESAGIPSGAIQQLLEELEQKQVRMHAFLLARHGKLVTEAYFAPYTPQKLHRMFSVSKSFVSLAIGLLEQEKLLSLDDCIADYFPEKLPPQVHPWIQNMTIRDMLKMQTCHSTTTYKAHPEKDWVESFFTTPPTHPSGTIFSYDTSSSHTLCALAEKLKGKPLLTYLREAFLDAIGFSKDAYFIKDPFGVSMGGSGLMARPLDLIKVGFLLLNHGKTQDGTALLPESYLKQACAFQTPTVHNAPSLEESLGYGYQFWRIQHDGYACYGMGGQLVIILPHEQLVCVTAADTQARKGGNQSIYDALYTHILPALQKAPLRENPPALQDLQKALESLSLPIVPGILKNTPTPNISGKRYKLAEPHAPFEQFAIEFKKDELSGTLHLLIRGVWQSLSFGMHAFSNDTFPLYEQSCASCAAWIAPQTFFIQCHLLDECVGTIEFTFTFQQEHATLFLKKTEETYFNEYQGFLNADLL